MRASSTLCTPGIFANGGFTLTENMKKKNVSVHTTPEEFKNVTIPAILYLCLRKPRSVKSRDYHDVIVLEKFVGSKSVSQKINFGDGLVCTVGLAAEI